MYTRTFSTVALVAAALLTGLALINAPARACDDRYPSSCPPPSAQEPDAEEADSSAQLATAYAEQSTAPVRRHRKNQHAAERRPSRENRSAERGQDTTERRRVEPRQDTAERRQDTTERRRVEPRQDTAERRPDAAERRQNSTGSISMLPWWRVDQPDAALHAAQSRSPTIAAADAWLAAANPAADASSAHVLSADENREINLAAAQAPAADPGQLNALDLYAADDPQPANKSWLHGLFAVLGGAFAAGSAARLFLV
jgi:hypothetical protein